MDEATPVKDKPRVLDVPLVSFRNVHFEGCGKPPEIDGNDPNRYVGYFQNNYGEQWLYVYDYTTCEAKLYGGDVGWEKAYSILLQEDESIKISSGLGLTAEEAKWLMACWMATGGTFSKVSERAQARYAKKEAMKAKKAKKAGKPKTPPAAG